MSKSQGTEQRLSRRDLLRRSGTLGAGILAVAGCGGTAENFVVTNNGNPTPPPTPTPTPTPGDAGLTFLFTRAQSAAVPSTTVTIEFIYLGETGNSLGSESRTYANSITVFPPEDTQAVRLIPRDANGFPLQQLQGNVTLPPAGQTVTINLAVFTTIAVTFTALTASPSQFDLTTEGQTQQLALSASFSNGEEVAFPTALLGEATYVSSDEASATVSATGLVTAVANGEPDITVSFTDDFGTTRQDTVEVNVNVTPVGPVAPPVEFVQPPVRRSENGFLSVLMQFDFTTNAVGTPFGVKNFSSRTINGTLAPPTIRLKPGDRLELPIDNLLPADNDSNSPTWQGPVAPADENTPHEWNTVNMHTHGFHVSPAQDNVLLQILPGNSYIYQYDLPSDHPDGTFWYHPHKHGGTAMHLFSGMAGMIVVEGALDQVPEIAAAADVVFVINELNLGGLGTNPNESEYFCPNNTGPNSYKTADSVYVVNGEYQPRMKVRPGQVVRLRILNASARGATPLTITGATNNWNILSFDGLTFPEMMADIPEFTLQPANRADVLVRFDTAGTYEITKQAYSPGGGGTLPLQVLAFIDVEGDPFPQSFPTGPLPVSPTLPNIQASEVTDSRTLVYNTSGGFTINGAKFSSSTINQIIPLGSVIEWRLENASGIIHPHHIHIQDIQVIATSDGFLNGLQFAAPGQNFPTPVWMDTVGIPPKVGSDNGWVIIRQRFPDFPGLFVQHCHILSHEDQGMMQLINVL